MSDLDITALVSRDELALADLDINDEVNYRLAQQFRPGGVTWSKEFVESPFVHGRYVVGERKQSTEGSLGVFVTADTHAALHTNVETLVDAFTEQRTYVLRLVVEGQDLRWKCERADYEVAFTTAHVNALYVPVAFSFHRHPIPVQGVI